MAAEVWYDLQPCASELWVVAGPPGANIEALRKSTDDLPEGFRWVEDDEWGERNSRVEILS